MSYFWEIHNITLPNGLSHLGFAIQLSLEQQDPLSATLFSIAIDVIIWKLDTRGNISTRLKQCAVYADDILIPARTKQVMIDAFKVKVQLSLCLIN
jgi:hypothetical protein